MESEDLSKILEIHERYGIMFLNQAIEAETVGNFYRASKMALYAWAHLRHAETTDEVENYLALVTRDYIDNPFKPMPFEYDPKMELDIAHSFAKYTRVEEQEGRKIILLTSDC